MQIKEIKKGTVPTEIPVYPNLGIKVAGLRTNHKPEDMGYIIVSLFYVPIERDTQYLITYRKQWEFPDFLSFANDLNKFITLILEEVQRIKDDFVIAKESDTDSPFIVYKYV